MSRPLMIAMLLGASIGVPYALSRLQPGLLSVGGEAAAVSSDNAAQNAGAAAEAQPPSASIAGIAQISPASSSVASLGPVSALPSGGARITPPPQVFRFDLTKEWVYRMWPRKTTGPTDVGLFSVRVPLVTGTGLHDLAGSLTYFFNTYGQVEHISFRGRTGDTGPLVRFLAQTYEFQREAAPPGEQLYQVKRTGRPQSELRTRAESVLRADAPHSSYSVELELARPGSKRLLPPRGIPLQIPAVAVSAPAAGAATPATAEPSATEAVADGESYLDKVRFATPDEELQVQRFRWPD